MANVHASDSSKIIDSIVDKVKKEGIFDQLRKDCLADVDLKVRVPRSQLQS